MTPPTNPLESLTPQHSFFVGIDSDGCAFDSMEIKQKECFIPNTVKIWKLQSISKYVRETEEWVNLYSKWRGINRWPALTMVFDLLQERPEVIRRGVTPPAASHLKAFIANDQFPKSNSGLKAYMQQYPDPELDTAWAWTNTVNETVEEIAIGLSPFPFVQESLSFLQDKADMIVVSATPLEALVREWNDAGIAPFVRLIAGQELGSKSVHLKLAAAGKYTPDHILMIGDAPGDYKAARDNQALFYPINPGREEESWELFYNEAMHKFLAGEYAGDYETHLVERFHALLPDTPPWKHK
jgi:phosphoglycolate phosphatase-like HAD superfamily hydrolase